MDCTRIEQRIVATAAILCAIVLGGCAHMNVPQVDPTGESLFVAPQTPPLTVTAQRAHAWETPGGQLPWDSVGVLLTPTNLVAPVGSEAVLLAGVAGPDNYLRMNERVEWTVAPGSVGEFVDFDRAGICDLVLADFTMPRKVTPTYAIGSTSRHNLRLTRGTPVPTDDVLVVRGQTWVTATSAMEGTSYITAYAPDVYGWDRRKQTATIHWIDARWDLPSPAAVPAGSRHALTTTVCRHTNLTPRPGWRVIYTVTDGPPAGFAPNGATSVEVETNSQGQATAELIQVQPAAGTNTVAVQVVRPQSPGDPAGSRLAVGGGTTLVTWSAPGLTLRASGPAVAAVGSSITFRAEVTNSGSQPAESVVITDELPPGTSYLSSTPAAQPSGNSLRWEIGRLMPGECRYVLINIRADQVGTLTNCAEAAAANGPRARDCSTTTVSLTPAPPTTPTGPSPSDRPQMEVRVTGPQTATVGEDATFQIHLTNVSQTTAMRVQIYDLPDPGLEHERANPEVQATIGPLSPGQSQTLPITFKVTKPGRLCHVVEVKTSEGFTHRTSVCLNAVAPGTPGAPTTPTAPPAAAPVAVSITGPTAAAPGETVTFDIAAANTSRQPLHGVQLRVSFDLRTEDAISGLQATRGFEFDRDDLVWTFPTVQPGGKAEVTLQFNRVLASPRACLNVCVVTAGGAIAERQHCLEIRQAAAGETPSLDMQFSTLTSPVEVGRTLTYFVTVANRGPTPARQVALVVTVPDEMILSPRMIEGPLFQPGPVPRLPLFRIEGQTVIFPTVGEVPPGTTLTYRIPVQAAQPGQVTLQARLESASLRQPLVRTLQTTINARP